MNAGADNVAHVMLAVGESKPTDRDKTQESYLESAVEAWRRCAGGIWEEDWNLAESVAGAFLCRKQTLSARIR